MPTSDVLAKRPVLVGVVHLPPLPGSPGWLRAKRRADPTADAWTRRAVSDARILAEVGFGAVIVENYGDAPFHATHVPPTTTAALAVAASAVRDALPPSVHVGVNCLRNDGLAAVAVAAAARLDFVRVNVLVGAVVTDQGLVEGEAAAVLRERERVAPDVRVLADVHVKHGVPLAPRAIEDEAADLLERGGADAVIVTGSRTGDAIERETLTDLRRALPDAPLLIGSGATRHTVRGLLALADGVIVGTAVKRGGRTTAPVDRRRAKAFMAAATG